MRMMAMMKSNQFTIAPRCIVWERAYMAKSYYRIVSLSREPREWFSKSFSTCSAPSMTV